MLNPALPRATKEKEGGCSKTYRRVESSFYFEKSGEVARNRHFCYNATVRRRHCLPYFNAGKIFLVPSFGLEVKERGKQGYGYARFRRGGSEKVSTESTLNFLGLNIAKLFRCHETRKLNKFWAAPDNLEPGVFKKPSWKRLAKKGQKLNAKTKENMIK